MRTHPQPANEGILYHDGNNRDLERLNQHIAENVLAHNTGIQLIRSEMAVLRSAIREQA
jgi:flagellar basal body rod protein FlgB